MTRNTAYEAARQQMEAQVAPLREQALRELGTPRSLFSDDCPSDIGRILMVDTFLWRRSGRATLLRRLALVAVALLLCGWPLLLLLGGIKSASPTTPWVVAGTCGAIFLGTLPRLLRQQRYTDFFVGERGCTVVNFKGDRRHVESRHTMRYSDYNVFLMGETLRGTIGQVRNERVESRVDYRDTLFTTAFFNMRHHHEGDELPSAGYDQGTHCDQYRQGVAPEPQYHFWLTVERRWTQLQLARLADDLAHMPRQTFYTFRPKDDIRRVAGFTVISVRDNEQSRLQPRAFSAQPALHLSTDGLQPAGGQLVAWADVVAVRRERDLRRNLLVADTAAGAAVEVDVAMLGNLQLLLELIPLFTGQPIQTTD